MLTLISENYTHSHVARHTLSKDLTALAATMSFGLINALNLDQPLELQSTFVVLQKVGMELEGNTRSSSQKQTIRELFPRCYGEANRMQFSMFAFLEKEHYCSLHTSIALIRDVSL